MRRLLAVGTALLFGGSLLHASTYYLAVAGLGGEPEYDQRFGGWAADLEKILQEVIQELYRESKQALEARKRHLRVVQST